jgi:hypothetical protein
MALRTKSDFIPNDVKLGGNVGRIALLTGSDVLDSCVSETENQIYSILSHRTKHGVSTLTHVLLHDA